MLLTWLRQTFIIFRVPLLTFYNSFHIDRKANLKVGNSNVVFFFFLQLWDAITGEEIYSFQHNHIVKSVTFSSDSGLLATGSIEKLIRVYDINRPDASE